MPELCSAHCLCPNQKEVHHRLQDAILLAYGQTKQPNTSLRSVNLSACFAEDLCACPGETAPEEEQKSNAPSQAKPVTSP